MGTSIQALARTALATTLLLAAQTHHAAGDAWPTFSKGLWEFDRTMERAGAPGKEAIKAKRCVDPGEDMKKQREMLAKAGCKLTPVTRSGNTYTYSAQCDLAGTAVQSTSVLTVESDGAYRLSVESRQDGVAGKERLVARRLGGC